MRLATFFGVLLVVATLISLETSSALKSQPTAHCSSFPYEKRFNNQSSLDDQRAWRQVVSDSPLNPDSEKIIAHIQAHGGNFLHPDFGSPRQYGIPYTFGRSGKVPVKFTAYGSESDPGPYRIPLNAPIEGGKRSNGDRHVLRIDRSCKLYELYRAFPGSKRWRADSGAIWDLRSAALRPDGWTSADAAGLPIYPGLVRYDELKKGRIDHALRVTFEQTQDGWLHPASHCAGATSNRSAPPMGMRLRLRAGYPLNKFSGDSLVIARALKRYGLIVADNGSNWFFQGATDQRYSDDNLNQLKSISGSAFEVVRSQASLHRC